MSSPNGWRGSTGTLWQQKPSNEYPYEPARPVSATPPDIDGDMSTPKSSRKGGLRKRFLSLTEGLANLISGNDKKSSNSLKNVSGSPKRLRKSIFYVDHNDSIYDSGRVNQNEMTVHELFKNYNNTLCRHSESNDFYHNKQFVSKSPAHDYLGIHSHDKSWTHSSRQTRSMSQGSTNYGGVQAVKAPPSPPPRRYTLWGITSSPNDIYNMTGNTKVNPPTPPMRTSKYLQMIPSVSSSIVLTPPSSPLLFRSNSFRPKLEPQNCVSKRTETPKTPRKELGRHPSPIFKFSGRGDSPQPHCAPSTPSPTRFSGTHSISLKEKSRQSSVHHDKLSPLSRHSAERSSRLHRSGVDRLSRASRSPSRDRKSSLFGLGIYRGDWYRRKAAKARLSHQCKWWK